LRGLFSRLSKKIGVNPGTVVYVGDEQTADVHIDVIDYSETELAEKRVDSVEECYPYKDSKTITWINIDGIHHPETIEKIGAHFGIHPLVLEDIANTGQRPKMEDTDDYIFIVIKMLYSDKDNGEIKSEQVSVIFGKSWVITFQETGDDVLDIVRQRIKRTVPRVRLMSADYLAYSLIDAIVDYYFIVLEQIGEKIEILEDDIAENPKSGSLDTIRNLKRHLIFLRKSVWPLREVIGGLERIDTKLIKKTTLPYLRDLYEHTIQAIDTVETFREMVSGLLDLYHTGVSNRMNEVMKVLTIFATIFIPLGFLAGVYGMNFNTGVSPFNMPELSFYFGYPMFWLLVLFVVIGLLWFFRHKKWL
jgi:magnesium transporter